jgi:flavin-dependent dehydrogenase
MHCDVAIAGAGPAGSALAVLLARAGLRVLLADRLEAGTPRAGETAPPDLRPLLAQAGLAALLDATTHVDAPSIVSVWGHDQPVERPHILSPFGRGLHLDRSAFDSALAAAAQASGAELRLRTAVRFRRREARGYDVVSRGRTIACADHVVLAGGRRTGKTELSGSRRYLDDHIGIAARFTAMRRPVERRTVIEAVPGGWFYLAALPRDRMIVVFMTRASAVPADKRGRHRLWLEALRRTRLVRLALASELEPDTISICDARASSVRLCAGSDWCAIGDARLAPDPLSGQGLLWAIRDAAWTADRLIAGWSVAAIEAAQARHREELADYQAIRTAVYAGEGRFPDDPYWASRTGAGADRAASVERPAP